MARIKKIESNIEHTRDGASSFGNKSKKDTIHWNRKRPDNLPLTIEFATHGIISKGNYWKRTKSRRIIFQQVLKGEALFIANGTEYLIKPGQIMIIHLGSDAEFKPAGSRSYEKQGVCIDGFACEHLLSLSGLTRFDTVIPKNVDATVSLFKKAFIEIKNKENGFQERLSLIAYELILLLGQSITKNFSRPVQDTIDLITNKEIKGDALGTSRAKAKLNLSQHLVKQFKMETGLTPTKYAIEEKLRLVRYLLKSTKLPLDEIASKAGYSSRSFMSRQFYSHSKMWPNEYRVKNRQ